MAEMKMCLTGIKELDDLLNGGFPEGACVLLAGSSGTGKTILSLEYLFRGAKEFHENGVYVTLTEPLFKVLKNLESLTFYDNEAVMSGAISIMDLRELSDKMGLKSGATMIRDPDVVLEVLENTVRGTKAKRLVLDSVTAICYHLKEPDKIRNFIFKLGTALAGMGCTAILTSEVPPNERVFSRFGVEEFISDGIILLDQFERKGSLLRTLQVVKMRGKDHKRTKQLLTITPQGIRLTPLIEE